MEAIIKKTIEIEGLSMDTLEIKPIPLEDTTKVEHKANEKLTSAEQGKLWSTYMGNSMAICVLSHMLQHVEDKEIKQLLENALSLAKHFTNTVKDIFNQENYPIPMGFSEKDVNLGADRLFTDQLYPHYLKYTCKAGMSIYGIAVSLMSRPDIRAFFIQCVNATMQLIDQINEVLLVKGLSTKPPFIPYPNTIDIIKKQNYLNGFFGRIRPMQALEITHLYENVENNAVSKAVLIGFSQVAQHQQVKSYMLRGKGIAAKHYDIFSKVLEEENLSSTPILDPFVTTSTNSPFSDKLMMFHKLDMFTMRVRSYGNALAFCARHDISQKYGRLVLEVGNFLEDGGNILIDNEWMEQPPQAVDREAIAIK
jgi:DNA-binding XRE family transcriptional regulator